MFLTIRPARPEDRPAVLEIFDEVVRAGDSYAFDPATSRLEAETIWFAPGNPKNHVYAAVDETDRILGSAFIRPNQPGLGDHVANAGFMVTTRARGHGVGRKMGEFALEEAPRLGFKAMQFNFVVASNKGAVKLWQDLGFSIIATVPGAFRHVLLGATDVHIMHRTL